MKKIILLMLFLSACGNRYPLGMQEQQWNTLSPAQQQQAVIEQQQQDMLRRQQIEQALYQQQEQQLYAERQHLEGGARLRLGITQEEWSRLTPDKKLDLRQEQEAIERQFQTTQAVVHQDNQLAFATHEIADAIHANSRRELYTNSAYGSVVDCELNGGNGKFASGLWKSKWSPIAPVRFSVAKGDAVDVSFQRRDRLKTNATFWVAFEPSGLEFCASEGTDKRYKKCRTYPVTEAYKQGVSQRIDIPNAIDGATLTCRFAPGRR